MRASQQANNKVAKMKNKEGIDIKDSNSSTCSMNNVQGEEILEKII